jgi:restriction enzyme bgcI subunit beta
MERLSEKEWKAFPIDAEFRMKKQGNVPTGALVSNSVLKDGMYPRIRVTSQNNGINGFTNVCDDKNYRAYSNFVSMSFLGNAFYHPYTASLDMKVHCLQYKDTKLNPAMGLFTVTMAERIASGTNYGNQLSSNDLAAKQILLPVDDKGNPDYAYMTLYSTEVRGVMLMRYKNFITGQLSQLEHKDIPALDEKEWGEFVLDDIFTVDAGKRLETRNKVEGNRPFIGATDNGNGVTGFVGNDNTSKDSNVLGVNYNGAPCIAFYHPYECIFTDDVKRLHLKNQEDNKFVLLFFTSIFAMQRVKYSYGYKFKEKRMQRQKLMLPVTDAGKPDYEYMEQYAKNMMLRKYEQYLAFIDRQSAAEEVNA